MLVLAFGFVVAAGAHEAALQAPILASPDSFFPAPGTTVPRNARFLVFDPTLDVVRITENGARVPLELVPAAGDDEARVMNFGALVPGESIAAEATCAGCGNTLELVWLVDDVLDTVPPAYVDEPPATSVGVDSNSPRQWGVQVCLPVLETPEPVVHQLDYLSIRETRINGGAGPGCNIGREEDLLAGTFFYLVVPATDDVDELCFIAAAIDVAALADVQPEHCVPLESTEEFTPRISGSCAQSRGDPSFAFALALLACVRRYALMRRMISSSSS